jgi:hypothetical protein
MLDLFYQMDKKLSNINKIKQYLENENSEFIEKIKKLSDEIMDINNIV